MLIGDLCCFTGADVGQVIPAFRKETKTPVCLTSPLLSDTQAASISGSGSPHVAASGKDNLHRRELKQHMEGKKKKGCLFSRGK